MYKEKFVKTIAGLEKYKNQVINAKDYKEILNMDYPTDLYLGLFNELMEIIRLAYIDVRKDYFIKDKSINYSPDTDYYYNREDIKALFRFRGDNAVFSAMHTQTMIDMVKQKVEDAKAKNIPFAKFIATFNLNEYETDNLYYIIHSLKFSLKQSKLAGLWQNYQIQKDIYPYLQYHTGEKCRSQGLDIKLDGVVRSVDDKFWNKYYPLNNFDCDCSVIQLTESEYIKIEQNEVKKQKRFSIPKGYARNVGKDFTLYCHWLDQLFPDY